MDLTDDRPHSGGEGELLYRIRWLRRTELDLHKRLAERRAALGDVGRPISDPLYQRLFFAHKNLSEERACAERDLAKSRPACGTRGYQG